MHTTKKTLTVLAGSVAGLAMLGGCVTAENSTLSPDWHQGTTLDQHELQVSETTQFLEVPVSDAASRLTRDERGRLRGFLAGYKSHGHGPIVMSLPANSANPQTAITAVTEARDIAWEQGISYEEMEGNAYAAADGIEPTIVLAYQSYETIAPECSNISAQNITDTSTNSDMPSLGCAIRKNQAAMIAYPGDVLGNRVLATTDVYRRMAILEKFRVGETTTAARSNEESGSVSTAVSE